MYHLRTNSFHRIVRHRTNIILSKPFRLLLAAAVVLAPLLTVTNTALACGVTCTYSDNWGDAEAWGTDWLAGEGVTIYSNGPSAPGGPSPDTWNCVAVSGAAGDSHCSSGYVTSGIKWQCVELVNRLYLTEGWISSNWSGNGYQMYDNAPSNLTKEASSGGHITYVSPGDVIAMTGGSTGLGHVAIVDSETGSGNTFKIASQNTNVVYDSSFGLSSGSITKTGWSAYTMQGVIHAPTRMMIVDGSSRASSEDFLGNSWTMQYNSSSVNAVGVGGTGRMMIKDTSGTVYAKDHPTDAWGTAMVSSGAQAIAVGGLGRMMVIDASGNVSAKDSLGVGWTPEYTLGGAKAIAVGGNGRQMIIDSSGNASAIDGIFSSSNPWTNGEWNNAKAIAVGGNGRMEIVDSNNDAWVKDTLTGSWSRVTYGSNVSAIAIGGKERMVIIATDGNAYYRVGIGATWSLLYNGATAIQVGSNGRLVVVDTSGQAHGKEGLTDGWTDLSSASSAAYFAAQDE